MLSPIFARLRRTRILSLQSLPLLSFNFVFNTEHYVPEPKASQGNTFFAEDRVATVVKVGSVRRCWYGDMKIIVNQRSSTEQSVPVGTSCAIIAAEIQSCFTSFLKRAVV